MFFSIDSQHDNVARSSLPRSLARSPKRNKLNNFVAQVASTQLSYTKDAPGVRPQLDKPWCQSQPGRDKRWCQVLLVCDRNETSPGANRHRAVTEDDARHPRHATALRQTLVPSSLAARQQLDNLMVPRITAPRPRIEKRLCQATPVLGQGLVPSTIAVRQWRNKS